VLKTVLGDKVEKVVVSSRLATSPAVLVTSQFGYSANMERIMKSQAFANPEKGAALLAKKTLEVNPRHPIIAALQKRAAADEKAAAGDELVGDIARLLYESALLNSGFSLEDTRAFGARVARLIKGNLALPSLDLLPEMELPAEEPSATPAPAADADAADVDEDADL